MYAKHICNDFGFGVKSVVEKASTQFRNQRSKLLLSAEQLPRVELDFGDLFSYL